jgi:hypothetical protein
MARREPGRVTTPIQRAEPGARRRAVAVLVGLACVGALLIAAAGHYRDAVRDWILTDPQAAAGRVEMVLQLAIVLTVAPLLVFGAYVWRLGSSVCREQRFPLAGQRVVRDTPIVSGAVAVRRGVRLQWVGVGVIAAGASLAIGLWQWIGMQ